MKQFLNSPGYIYGYTVLVGFAACVGIYNGNYWTALVCILGVFAAHWRTTRKDNDSTTK